MQEPSPPAADPRPRNAIRRDWLVMGLLAAGLVLSAPARTQAGGGPENVLLVVNANSAGSKRVANHYAALRELPASNVLYLDYDDSRERIGGDTFRKKILRPILEAIDARRLSLQIDMIAYSTDFPWLVNLRKDFPKGAKLSTAMKPTASITGATYLYPFVMSKSQAVNQLDTNWYVPTDSRSPRRSNLGRCTSLGTISSRAFRSRYAWSQNGRRLPDLKRGRRYLMATMLGVTTGRGNTVDEVIASLDRAVEAEASPPDGTFYFMRNNSPRSTPRHACYTAAVNELRKLGAKAVVKNGVIPKGANDLIGLSTGDRLVKLREASVRVLPGAITDNLTSYGGILSKKAYQTPLTDQIRDGATGACGTVEEPTPLQAKFPLPSLHVHYRRGCSLAESFYQSVAAPYQLLIVGDPLCQPWANRPSLSIDGWPGAAADPELGDLSSLGFAQLGISAGTTQAKPPEPETISKEPSETQDGEPNDPPPAISIKPQVASASGKPGGMWELFIDGRLRMRLPSGKGIEIPAGDLGPGWHELRCVAIDSSPLEAQKRRDGAILIDQIDEQRFQPAKLTLASAAIDLAGVAGVEASAPGAERIKIVQHSRVVATIEGDSGRTTIPAELLGQGRVRLQAIAEPSGVASPPIWGEVR